MIASAECPYCNHQNQVHHQYGLQLVLCDSENGGCDEYFAVKTSVTVFADSYAIEKQGKGMEDFTNA